MRSFPQRGDECIQLQTDADRLYRRLLANAVLGRVQAVETEPAYLRLILPTPSNSIWAISIPLIKCQSLRYASDPSRVPV